MWRVLAFVRREEVRNAHQSDCTQVRRPSAAADCGSCRA